MSAFWNIQFRKSFEARQLTCARVHDGDDTVIFAASYSVPTTGGLGCLDSTASQRYSSSPLCPSCQSLPDSYCWTEETARPARQVGDSREADLKAMLSPLLCHVPL